LEQDDHILLGLATGKSRRGLDALLGFYGWENRFVTTQVSDNHPSKPHPSMILTAMSETGVDAARTVMIGDTSYDIDMARAAEVNAIGVEWGYHPKSALLHANAVVSRPDALYSAIHTILG
jgi:phosphoglycolate phosphatase